MLETIREYAARAASGPTARGRGPREAHARVLRRAGGARRGGHARSADQLDWTARGRDGSRQLARGARLARRPVPVPIGSAAGELRLRLATALSGFWYRTGRATEGGAMAAACARGSSTTCPTCSAGAPSTGWGSCRACATKPHSRGRRSEPAARSSAGSATLSQLARSLNSQGAVARDQGDADRGPAAVRGEPRSSGAGSATAAGPGWCSATSGSWRATGGPSSGACLARGGPRDRRRAPQHLGRGRQADVAGDRRARRRRPGPAARVLHPRARGGTGARRPARADGGRGRRRVDRQRRGDHRAAARLGGAAEAERAELGISLGPNDVNLASGTCDRRGLALGDAFDAAWADGRRVPFEQAARRGGGRLASMNRSVALARACHPVPTAGVTALGDRAGGVAGHTSAAPRSSPPPCFTGQLSIGWSNDAIDAERDARAARSDKPVASGEVPRRTVALAGLAALVACDRPLAGARPAGRRSASAVRRLRLGLQPRPQAHSVVLRAVRDRVRRAAVLRRARCSGFRRPRRGGWPSPGAARGGCASGQRAARPRRRRGRPVSAAGRTGSADAVRRSRRPPRSPAASLLLVVAPPGRPSHWHAGGARASRWRGCRCDGWLGLRRPDRGPVADARRGRGRARRHRAARRGAGRPTIG